MLTFSHTHPSLLYQRPSPRLGGSRSTPWEEAHGSSKQRRLFPVCVLAVASSKPCNEGQILEFADSNSAFTEASPFCACCAANAQRLLYPHSTEPSPRESEECVFSLQDKAQAPFNHWHFKTWCIFAEMCYFPNGENMKTNKWNKTKD